MASKINILGKEENARESHIKGNKIYQGRKLQGISGKEKGNGKGTRNTRERKQGKEETREEKIMAAGKKKEKDARNEKEKGNRKEQEKEKDRSRKQKTKRR